MRFTSSGLTSRFSATHSLHMGGHLLGTLDAADRRSPICRTRRTARRVTALLLSGHQVRLAPLDDVATCSPTPDESETARSVT